MAFSLIKLRKPKCCLRLLMAWTMTYDALALSFTETLAFDVSLATRFQEVTGRTSGI